jgi:PhnB protein
MPVKAIPDGYHSVTPYLICRDAGRALDFYKKAFNATELMRMDGPGGKVGHAEIKIGDSVVMLADEHPDFEAHSPQKYGGTPVSMLIYLPNVDQAFKQAIAAGATEKRPLKDQFYGDRSGTLVDPFGHVWTVATHTEDVSEQEMDRRLKEMMKQSK